MRQLTIFALFLTALTQYSCQMVKDKFDVIDAAVEQANETKRDSILAGHPIQFYLNHPDIPQVCKDLFTNVRKPTDDADVLSLLDSVFTSNDETRPFYFLTITKTMAKADGAYAEPLGIMAKKFVEERTKEFVSYFLRESLLSDIDFQEWARSVAGEVEISAEGKEMEELDRFANVVRLNCDQCFQSQEKIIESFIERVVQFLPK
jgi:hypothetical protein